MLTRIRSSNIKNEQVLKEDLAPNAVDGFKLDVPNQGNLGDVLTTDGMGNLSFAPIGGVAFALDSLVDVDITTVPPVDGDSLVYDQLLNLWVPKTKASSLGELTDVDLAVAPLNGYGLVFNGITQTWQAVDIGASPTGYSKTYVVDDLIDRDALSPTEGDQAFVRNAGDGEYAIYLWEGTEWVKISTKDAARTDARTIEALVGWASVGPLLLGNVSQGSRATLITVEVTVPFNGAPSLTVGDGGDNSRLIDNGFHDLSEVGTYNVQTDYVYDNVLDTDLFVYFSANGATQGSARVLVTYV